MQRTKQRVRRFSDHFTTISSHFFDNCLYIFHKTELQTVILRCWTDLNHNWFKSYDTKRKWGKKAYIGPFQSNQFLSLVFIPLCIHTDIFGRDGMAPISCNHINYFISFWFSLTYDFQKEFKPMCAYISLHEARCNISCFPIKHNRKDPRVSTQSGMWYT